MNLPFFLGLPFLGSRGASIDFKGFFDSKVRKFKKIAKFATSTFELEQRLGNKKKASFLMLCV